MGNKIVHAHTGGLHNLVIIAQFLKGYKYLNKIESLTDYSQMQSIAGEKCVHQSVTDAISAEGSLLYAQGP